MSSRLGIAGIVLLAAFGLAACGGGGGSGSGDSGMMPDPTDPPEQTAQQMCEAEGGRWNADETCTSATDLAAETAAKTKAALTKEAAIAAEAGQANDADAGLGGSAATATGNAEGAYNLAIARDRSGTTVTVTVEGATDADDEDFMGDQPGQMLTRTMEATETTDAMTEVAVVHTDIEAPVATPFAMVQGQALNVMSDDGQAPGSDENADALAVDEGDADVRALVQSSSFTSGTEAELRFANDDASTTDMDEAFEGAGTYNGAMGKYRCTGSSVCTVTLDATGAITAMSDGWVFTPDAGATSDVPDADYLHYGFWLKKTTDEDGAVAYDEVETFAGSNIAATGDVSGVEGTAKYTGGAAGVYVHKTFAEDGTSEATSGHFTATASLTATFGGDGVAVNDQNKISGTIDNFMLSGGEENSWEVTLGGDITTATGVVSGGTAKGNVMGEDGSFSATFHGPVGDHDSDADTPEIPYPHTVVGEFNSVFSNGSVAGGFGARKTE